MRERERAKKKALQVRTRGNCGGEGNMNEKKKETAREEKTCENQPRAEEEIIMSTQSHRETRQKPILNHDYLRAYQYWRLNHIELGPSL